MVKVKDPKVFDILDRVSIVLRNQMSEQSKLIRAL
jgi:hypothetical protein